MRMSSNGRTLDFQSKDASSNLVIRSICPVLRIEDSGLRNRTGWFNSSTGCATICLVVGRNLAMVQARVRFSLVAPYLGESYKGIMLRLHRSHESSILSLSTKFMASTNRKGDVSTLKIAAALALKGEVILIPFSGSERYDLALDRQGTLYRVQCKTGRFRDGAVVFNTCSMPQGKRRHYKGDVDAFGVYCAELDAVYLVPIDRIKATTACWLRVDPPKDNRRRKFNAASEFRI